MISFSGAARLSFPPAPYHHKLITYVGQHVLLSGNISEVMFNVLLTV